MNDNINSTSDEFDFIPDISFDKNDFFSEPDVRVLRLMSDLGIDSLPEQYVNRLIKSKTFSFNVMLLGQSGAGKSTLINSLFRRQFDVQSDIKSHSQKCQLICNYYDLEERDVRLKLGVIESKGFIDHMNKDKPFESVVDYIDRQFESYLSEELKTHRSPTGMEDTRVHVCLYFLCANGNSLSAIDVVVMKELDKRVNLIPLIAKSDSFTTFELNELKVKIMSEMDANSIGIYRLPTDEPEVLKSNALNNSLMPFAISASNDFIRVGDRDVRARVYPWGSVLVDDENHSDLSRLRNSILGLNLYDLNVTTHTKYYNDYRSQRLEQLLNERQTEHLLYMKRTKDEMIARFEIKLKAKEEELKRRQNELNEKFVKMSEERIKESMELDLFHRRLEEDIKDLSIRRKLLAANRLSDSNSTDTQTPTTSKKKFNFKRKANNKE